MGARKQKKFNDLTVRDYKRLLERLSKQEEKIEELRSQNISMKKKLTLLHSQTESKRQLKEDLASLEYANDQLRRMYARKMGVPQRLGQTA